MLTRWGEQVDQAGEELQRREQDLGAAVDRRAAQAIGKEVVVEAAEAAGGQRGGIQRITPQGVAAFNPAFDVTPAELITSFITELGVLRPPFEESLREIMDTR